jgi:predicted enzyme related to lactoylglutathione lyase
MFAKINHIAITTDYYAVNGKFYEALFGMKTSSKPRPARAVPVGDGQIGLNNIPRREGHGSGFDHIGFEVKDIKTAIERIQKFDSRLEFVKRPSVRPNAAWTVQDAEFNMFDLAEANSSNSKDIFSENNWEQPRYINHIALRAKDVDRSAQFYADVFELKSLNRPNDENRYLSDGRVTLMIRPWSMANYIGHDPKPPGFEHIGFKVESIEAVKRDMDDLLGQNPQMRTRPLGYGDEGQARLKLISSCTCGTFQLTDMEGVYLDISEN